MSDAKGGDEVFEAVSSFGESGGVDGSVVGEGGRWWAVVVNVLDESIDHDFPCDAGVGVEGEQISGVVV